MTRAATVVAFVMGISLLAVSGFLAWLEHQGHLPEPWPGVGIGCLGAGMFSLAMVAVGGVRRD